MLPPPFDKLCAKHTKPISYARDTKIFRENDTTRGMFFIVRGVVELRRHTAAGASLVIHTAKTGETFAEASLFSEKYHCDAITLESTDIIELNKGSLLQLFSDDIEFATKLARQFTLQIQEHRRKLELLAIGNATERVYRGVAEGLLKHDIKSFSSEIGLQHETVYRSLSSLVAQGRMIKIARGVFAIPRSPEKEININDQIQ